MVAITSSYMLPCDADSNVVDDNNINQDHAVAYLTKIASIDVLMCCIYSKPKFKHIFCTSRKYTCVTHNFCET